MMKAMAWLFFVVVVIVPLTAGAQPFDPKGDMDYTPSNPPVDIAARRGEAGIDAGHRIALVPEDDPAFKRAQTLRGAGIALAVLGPVVGVGMGFGGLMSGLGCVASHVCESTNTSDRARGLLLGGVIVFSAGLGAGLAMAVVGNRKMDEVRKRHQMLPLQADLSVGSGRAAVSATWRF